ncbi:MAG: organic solvent tolerance protein OstA [Deltaproteobacteria bacterium]|nr:organic solvent tolerance protein OstA [Deltaproteobacteria bacterium]
MLALLVAAALGAGAAPVGAAGAPRGEASKVHIDWGGGDVDYRYRERRAVMTGKPLVTMTRGDAVLTCKRLTAESDEAGKLSRATCEGDARLTQGERVVTCETAVYESASAQVTCTGNPLLKDGRSEASGEVLVYYLDEGRVTLTRGQGKLYEEPGKELPLSRPLGGGSP